jgi:hypothetical protein
VDFIEFQWDVSDWGVSPKSLIALWKQTSRHALKVMAACKPIRLERRSQRRFFAETEMGTLVNVHSMPLAGECSPTSPFIITFVPHDPRFATF